jgi:uncharacterized protein YjiS (DUF1127 family)
MTSLTHEVLELRSEPLANLSLLERLRAYRDRRQAYASLVALDDRLLADMGLQRANLKAEVFGVSKEDKPSLFARLQLSLQRARRRRATIDALQALPDHVLADIGIERALIGEYAAAQLGENRWPYEPNLQAPAVRRQGLSGLAKAVVRPLRHWKISRHAAGQMAQIDAANRNDKNAAAA